MHKTTLAAAALMLLVSTACLGALSLDFETSTHKQQFVDVIGSGGKNDCTGETGTGMQYTVYSGSCKVQDAVGGNDVLLGANGSADADLHVQYYSSTAYGNGSPTMGLLVKLFDAGDTHQGGYVACLKVEGTDLNLYVGAHTQPNGGVANWEFYSAPEHTAKSKTAVQTGLAEPKDDTYVDLGWYHVTAGMADVGGDMQVTVVVEDPGGTELTPMGGEVWTDSGTMKDLSTGQVGLVSATSWSRYTEVDNFNVVPEPATLTLLGLGAIAAAGLRRRSR